MDATRFDALAVALSRALSRRKAMKLAAGSLLGPALVALGVAPVAALRPNGARCRVDSQCESGLCRRREGEKTCRRARNQGTCTIASNAGAREPVRTECQEPGTERCLCWVTTAGRSFCGQFVRCGCANNCGDIPGAVCVERFACGPVGAPTACVLPCPTPD